MPTEPIMPSIKSCGANASTVKAGESLRLQMEGRQGTYSIAKILFELDSKENYSYTDYSGNTAWKDLETTGLLGTHTLKCMIVDSQGNYASMDGGTFTVDMPATTTTSTTTSTTSSVPTTTIPFRGIIIHAKGKAAAGVLPRMQLWIDGRMKAQWDALDIEREYIYETELSGGGHNIDIVYSNDCTTDTADRDLYVYYIEVNGRRMDPTDNCVRYDKGVGDAAFDGVDVISGQVEMYWSGALRFKLNGGYVPTTTTTSTTTTTMVCLLKGDYPKCGEVTLSEVVAYINLWGEGRAELKDVVALINAYENP